MTELTENPPILAAYRDARYSPPPKNGTSKRGHVLRADGLAACGLVMFMGDPEPAEQIPGALRCSRKGCHDKWPTATPEDAWHNA